MTTNPLAPPLLSPITPLSGTISAARRVHDTPELLEMILRYLGPNKDKLSKETRKSLALASRICWRHLARATYREVSWTKYLAVKAPKADTLSQEYCTMIKEITVSDHERYQKKVDVVFTREVLLDVKKTCPGLSRVVSRPGKGDLMTATFPESKLPHLLRRHSMNVMTLGRIQGCGGRWKAPRWKGWEVSGELDLTVYAGGEARDGTQAADAAAKKRIAESLITVKSGWTPISKLELWDELRWSLDDLRLIVCGKDPGSESGSVNSVPTISELSGRNIDIITAPTFERFAIGVGSRLTWLYLSVDYDPRRGQLSSMPIYDIPDLLDSVRSYLTSLVDFKICITCDDRIGTTSAGTSLEEDRAPLSLWESTGPLQRVTIQLRQSNGYMNLDTVGVLHLVRRLIMREDRLKKHAVADGLSINLFNRDDFRKTFYELLKYFRSAQPSERNAFFTSNLSDLRLNRPLDITRLRILPDGSYANWKTQTLLRTVEQARVGISDFHHAVEAHKHSLRQRKFYLSEAVITYNTTKQTTSKLHPIREDAERAFHSLSSMGVQLGPLTWPDTDDIPTFSEEAYETVAEAQVEIDRLEVQIRELERRVQEEETNKLIAWRNERDAEQELTKVLKENAELKGKRKRRGSV